MQDIERAPGEGFGCFDLHGAPWQQNEDGPPDASCDAVVAETQDGDAAGEVAAEPHGNMSVTCQV